MQHDLPLLAIGLKLIPTLRTMHIYLKFYFINLRKERKHFHTRHSGWCSSRWGHRCLWKRKLRLVQNALSDAVSHRSTRHFLSTEILLVNCYTL